MSESTIDGSMMPCTEIAIIYLLETVCLMSQSWDTVASMHDQYMHGDIVHVQTVSCLGSKFIIIIPIYMYITLEDRHGCKCIHNNTIIIIAQ